MSDPRQASDDTRMELEKETKGAAAESGVAFDALEREFQEVGVGCLVTTHCWSHAKGVGHARMCVQPHSTCMSMHRYLIMPTLI